MNAKSHVLVVDDEADIRELLGMTLARMGVESHGASSCEEALALLAVNSYNLCLTDMRLPDGDCLSVLEYVAKIHPQTPVAVIKAHGSTENAVAALKAGACDYLAKPVSLEQLRALWHGYRIAVHISDTVPQGGVDTAQDLERVRAHFAQPGI